MAPRRPTMEEQQDEFRQTLENFTLGLQEALQTAVTNALTTVLEQQNARRANQREPQHQQVFHEESEEGEIVDNLFANPAQNQNREARQAGSRRNQPDHGQAMGQVLPPQRWEAGFRLDIPEFTGSLNAGDFIDWLNMVEEILDFKQVPDDMRVPLVATRFKNRASAWWSQLKESRRHSGKSRIYT